MNLIILFMLNKKKWSYGRSSSEFYSNKKKVEFSQCRFSLKSYTILRFIQKKCIFSTRIDWLNCQRQKFKMLNFETRAKERSKYDWAVCMCVCVFVCCVTATHFTKQPAIFFGQPCVHKVESSNIILYYTAQ